MINLATILTLTTDFGIKDGNVGAMKGVIWSIVPGAHIADLSHMISPQNIPEAGLVLSRAVPYFPAGTVHVVVVDPGVGTARRPMAARLGEQFFVGPDNGVITRYLAWANQQTMKVEFVHLDRPEFWCYPVSHVFHGRDIFAPCAAHLARGLSLHQLGSAMDDPVLLTLPEPMRTERGWRGEVMHIDHFGNIHTNLSRSSIGEPSGVTIRLCGVNLIGLQRTFGERSSGELVALYGSNDDLIVSVVNGNAAQRLGAKPGDCVDMLF